MSPPSQNTDLEGIISQVENCALQLQTWESALKDKENYYDNYLNQYKQRTKELETTLLDLRLDINKILGDFEGVSDTERANNMEAKKSRLIKYTQDMEQKLAAMEVSHQDDTIDSEQTKDIFRLAFYQNLGVEVQSTTEHGEHTLKLVNYQKPNVCNLTIKEADDDFTTAQKIWDCISL